MPYCPECGMRHDSKQRICSTCGWNIPDKGDAAEIDRDDEKQGSSKSEIKKEGAGLPGG